MRYEARETGGIGTWWVADTERRLSNSGQDGIVATFWGDYHPDPEGAAKAEADRLNANA